MMPQPQMPPQITPQMIQAFLMAQQPPQGAMPQQGQSPMPQGAPPIQQMPPQGMPPQAPPSQANMPPPMAGGQMNPNIAAFMQQMQRGQGQPPMNGMPPRPSGMPPQGAPQGPPMSPQMMQMIQQRHRMMQNQQMAQQLAQQGRNGDTMLAHMTPGEIAVPPEVQTPKVLATLKKEFEKKGAHVQQAQVGNPASSINPATGTPEYNFMSMFLPAALGIAGAAAAPFTGGASLGLSDLALASIGGGVGSAAGSLLTGATPLQAGLSGLGGAAGGYIGGGGLSSAASGAGSQSITPGMAQAVAGSANPSQGLSALQQMGYSAPGANAAQGLSQGFGSASNPDIGNLWGNLPGMDSGARFNPLAAAGSGVGSALGYALGTPAKSTGPQLPAGFNNPLTPSSQLPSFQQQLGYNTYNGPMPNFNNYNPQTNNPGAWNFYGT